MNPETRLTKSEAEAAVAAVREMGKLCMPEDVDSDLKPNQGKALVELLAEYERILAAFPSDWLPDGFDIEVNWVRMAIEWCSQMDEQAVLGITPAQEQAREKN